MLFSVLRRQNEILALGYVTARIVECVFIALGILAVLAVVTEKQLQERSQQDAVVLAVTCGVAGRVVENGLKETERRERYRRDPKQRHKGVADLERFRELPSRFLGRHFLFSKLDL